MSSLSFLKRKAREAESDEDWVQAIELYGKAVAKAREDGVLPSEIGLYNRIGDLYMELDDSSQAVYHYLIAAEQYAEEDLHSSAVALCRKVLRVAPDQVDAYRQLATLHAETGLEADARDELDHYLRGVLETGEVREAVPGLADLVERLSDEPMELAEARRLAAEEAWEEAFERIAATWAGDDYVEWIEITNAAAELAVEHGVDLVPVEGTGKDGRILKADVQAAVEEQAEEAEAEEAEAEEEAEEPAEEPETAPDAEDPGAGDGASDVAADEDERPDDATIPSLLVELDTELVEAGWSVTDGPPPVADPRDEEEGAPEAESGSEETEPDPEPAPAPEPEPRLDPAVLRGAAEALAASARGRTGSPALAAPTPGAPALLPAEAVAAASSDAPRVVPAREAPWRRALARREAVRERAAANGRPAGDAPAAAELPGGLDVRSRRPDLELLWLADATAEAVAAHRGASVYLPRAAGPPRERERAVARSLEETVRARTGSPALAPAPVGAPALLPAEAVAAAAADAPRVLPAREAPWRRAWSRRETHPERPTTRVAALAGRSAAPWRAPRKEGPRIAPRKVRPTGPAGPLFGTPGRSDYLPAGADVDAGSPGPGPALAWLADAVAGLASSPETARPAERPVPAAEDEAPGETSAGRAPLVGIEEEARWIGAGPTGRAADASAGLWEALVAGASPEPAVRGNGDGAETDEPGDDETGSRPAEETADGERAAEGERADDRERADDAAPATDRPEQADEVADPNTGREVTPAGDPDREVGGTEDAREEAAADEEAPSVDLPRPAPGPAPPVEVAASGGPDFTALLEHIGWLNRGAGDGAPADGTSDGRAGPGADRDGGASGSTGTGPEVPAPWKRPMSSDGPEAPAEEGAADAAGEKAGDDGGDGEGSSPDFTEMLQDVGWLDEEDRRQVS